MADFLLTSRRWRDILNSLLALYLLGTGVAAIVLPVPELPAVFALLALALLNRHGLNRPAWIIGSIVLMLLLWGSIGGWLTATGGLGKPRFTAIAACACRRSRLVVQLLQFGFGVSLDCPGQVAFAGRRCGRPCPGQGVGLDR